MGEKVSLDPGRQISDPYDYYVDPPKDGVAVAGRVDRVYKQRISEIVQSGKLRYRTESDLLRAAIHFFFVEVLAPRMDNRFQDEIRLLHAAVVTGQTLARVGDSLQFCKDTKTAVTKLVLQDAMEQAVEVYVLAVRAAEGSSEPFRSHALRALRSDPDLTLVRTKATAWEKLEEEAA